MNRRDDRGFGRRVAGVQKLHRPDFRELNRLTESLQKLDTDFQQMFDDAPLQEAELREACSRMLRAQAVADLADIPVGELRSARAGIRVAALEEAGYLSLLDLYREDGWRLQSIDGIGEKQAASIRAITDEFLNRMSETGRIRLQPETPEASETGERSRALILLLSRYRQAALIRRDAEPLREELHTQVERYIRNIPVRSGLKWVFSLRRKKENTVLSIASLVLFARDSLCMRAERFVSLYRKAMQMDEDEALEDFRRNSAPYYALLERLTGTAVPQEMVYSSIPAKLAAQIDAMELDLRAFRGDLRAYQAFGVRYILTQKRVLLGDEMGLGKTIQAIAAMAHLSAADTPKPHFLIVCPASVMINWCREIAKFSDVKGHLLYGSFREDAFRRWREEGGAAVTNYESMGKIAPRVDGQMRLSLLVIDEAHYIKNPEAKRTRLIHSLEEESERILLMTGTPLENNVIEMCQLIGFVRPDMVDGIRENAAMRHVPAFREMLAPVYLRRQREQVLEELPPCTEEEEWCAMTPQDLAFYTKSVMEESFNSMRRVSFLQEDLKTSSKAQRMLELCAQAGDEGKKIVIYSYFRETIRKAAELLEEQFRPERASAAAERMPSGEQELQAEQNTSEGQVLQTEQNPSEEPAVFIGQITGSTPAADRQKIVDRFTAAPAGSILLCQVQAGGTGLNIQTAGVVIFCEPQIKPSLTSQAISRVYRMGQVQNVLVRHLLCENTVDEAVRRLLEEKQAEFDLFADESALADAADRLLDREWIHRFLEEEHRKYLPALPPDPPV